MTTDSYAEVQVAPQHIRDVKRLARAHNGLVVQSVSYRLDPHPPAKHHGLAWLSAIIRVEGVEEQVATFIESLPLDDWEARAVHADTQAVLEAAAAATRLLGGDDPSRVGLAVTQAFGDDADDPLDLFGPIREDVLHAAACRWEWLGSDDPRLARAASDVTIPAEHIAPVAAEVARMERQSKP